MDNLPKEIVDHFDKTLDGLVDEIKDGIESASTVAARSLCSAVPETFAYERTINTFRIAALVEVFKRFLDDEVKHIQDTMKEFGGKLDQGGSFSKEESDKALDDLMRLAGVAASTQRTQGMCRDFLTLAKIYGAYAEMLKPHLHSAQREGRSDDTGPVKVAEGVGEDRPH